MVSSPGAPVFLADCPARFALEVLSDKWAVVVLHGLSQAPRRHGELVDLVGGVSRKVLTQTLRRLELSGLVERRPRGRTVEYRLTGLGRTLDGPIEALTDWARTHGAEVSARRSGDGSATAGRPPGPQ